MKIKKFESFLLDENCYAVTLPAGIIIVDPGDMTKDLNEFLKNNGSKVKYILLTHRHFDHILAVSKAKQLCENAKVVIHESDAMGLKSSSESLASLYKLIQTPVEPDITVSDNDVLRLGKTEIKVVHTPGHTIGSVCYIIKNAIFTGDTLFKGAVGRTDFPTGSAEDLENSLKKLKQFDESYELYPGHGPETTLEYENKRNRFIRNL